MCQWQEARVLTAGITTTTTASTCRRLEWDMLELVSSAWTWTQIWPASAIKKKWILSKASRKNFPFYYRAMLRRARLCHSKSSVRPSVCHVEVDFHTGWNTSKIISPPNSLRPMLGLTPNMGDLAQREHPQNWGGIRVGSGAQKTCEISKKVQDRTKVTIKD